MTFTTETLETPDGIKLRFGVQTPENAGQHILILQGRGEYIERYQETADELAARGFGCVTFDFRGVKNALWGKFIGGIVLIFDFSGLNFVFYEYELIKTCRETEST